MSELPPEPFTLSTLWENPYLLSSLIYLLALIGVGFWKARKVKDS